MNSKYRFGRVIVGFVAASLILAACNGGAAAPASKGTVNIAVNPWVGYEADAAVVAYLLEKKLGYTVVKKDLAEDVSWQGFESGEVDVILENWGHPDLEKTYITEKKVAMDGGQTGNVGIILVLSMVVVGGLIGAGGLGYDVVAGFVRRDFFGEGLAAAFAIVLLGIMLDRITQSAGGSRSRAAASSVAPAQPAEG